LLSELKCHIILKNSQEIWKCGWERLHARIPVPERGTLRISINPPPNMSPSKLQNLSSHHYKD
jgi:hypothetical protein